MTSAEPGFAPAKVNLFLHVTGRRTDGYHLLDSLVVFAGIGDRLEAAPAEALSLAIDGPEGAGLSAGADNLVLRAGRALAAATAVPAGAALRLTKRLPVASGIGGGSADAAAALRLLVALWRCEADLPAIALTLGADVPVCLASRAARMQGVGEQIGPAPALPPFGLLLANPRIALETRAVFARREGGFRPAARLPGRWSDAAAMARDLAETGNDLEAAAAALCPAILAVRAAIAAQPGCLLARMSGSGATCFGLFATAAEAERAAAALPPAWWRWGGAPLG